MVCLEAPVDPLILPCLHGLHGPICTLCWYHTVEADEETGEDSGRCPFCRQEHVRAAALDITRILN